MQHMFLGMLRTARWRGCDGPGKEYGLADVVVQNEHAEHLCKKRGVLAFVVSNRKQATVGIKHIVKREKRREAPSRRPCACDPALCDTGARDDHHRARSLALLSLTILLRKRTVEQSEGNA